LTGDPAGARGPLVFRQVRSTPLDRGPGERAGRSHSARARGLGAVAGGLTNPQIAERLGLSDNT